LPSLSLLLLLLLLVFLLHDLQFFMCFARKLLFLGFLGDRQSFCVNHKLLDDGLDTTLEALIFD